MSSLSLTGICFNAIIEKVQIAFLKKHNLKELPKSFQLYGYGDFVEEKPSLKLDFEALGTEFINGKYLYDKIRAVSKGKPNIKLNSYYSNIILLYLGYDNIEILIGDLPLSKNEKEAQESLLKIGNTNKTFYYVNYYFGEDNRILKGQTSILNNFKKVKHTYLYPDANNQIVEYYNFGNIIRREDTLHIHTKTLLDGKIVEGGNEIYYIGHNDPSDINYMMGTYCTFDIYTHIVAGKTILEKCESKEAMIKMARSPKIPAYIAQEIRSTRFTSKALVPKHYLQISHMSPYASIYSSLPGTYKLNFFKEKTNLGYFRFRISKNTYEISSLDDNVLIEKETIQLINKGSVVHFYFNLEGIIAFDKLDVYLKTYYLNDTNKTEEGVFSGIDRENRLVNGKVVVEFKNN